VSDKPSKGVALFEREMQQAYEKHATALGEVVFHWNDLQERFAELFCFVSGTTQAIGFAIWYALTSDRTQRELLKVALEASQIDPDFWKGREQAVADIEWLLKEALKLANRRNDAIHAPYDMSLSLGPKQKLIVVRPSYWQGNPRAKALEKKDLASEFEWYAATAQTLARFARALIAHLEMPGPNWPERPRLPALSEAAKSAQ
jgi:hypothetical protein